MTCDLKIFSQYIADFLRIAAFQDACVNGLQVEGKRKINSIATAVTSSLFVIKRARELKVDALITHHGLFLRGKETLVVSSMKEKLQCLLDAGISLLSYHLPLDAHEEIGNNWAVAKKLGWHNLQPFGLSNGMYIGVRGNFSEISCLKLEKQLSQIYGTQAQAVLGGKEKISSCGIISGGAHKWLQEAVGAGLDCFVTGTTDEPVFHIAHEEKINFLSYGHAATERIGVQLLGQHLHKHFGLSHHFIDEKNPF